jgi:hypothetical protein
MGADLEVPAVIVVELPEILNCRGRGEWPMSMSILKPLRSHRRPILLCRSPPPHNPPQVTAAVDHSAGHCRLSLLCGSPPPLPPSQVTATPGLSAGHRRTSPLCRTLPHQPSPSDTAATAPSAGHRRPCPTVWLNNLLSVGSVGVSLSLSVS